MVTRFQQTEDGEVYLPIPPEMLNELGWKEGDLLEIIPMARALFTSETKEHIENLIHIRKARM